MRTETHTLTPHPLGGSVSSLTYPCPPLSGHAAVASPSYARRLRNSLLQSPPSPLVPRHHGNGLAGVRAVAISAGSAHNLVMAGGGAVYSFGHGEYGKLGHGDTSDVATPKQIEALRSVRVVAVAPAERPHVAQAALTITVQARVRYLPASHRVHLQYAAKVAPQGSG